MKRLFSVLSAVCLTLTLAGGALAAEWTPSKTQTQAILGSTGASVVNAAGEETALAEGDIVVTNLAACLEGKEAKDLNTAAVYNAALAAESTSAMLNMFSVPEEVQAALEEQIAALGLENVTLDNYQSASLFDVSAAESVLSTMEEGSSIQVSVKVDGVTPDSNVLALHFKGDAVEAEDAAAAVANMEVELLPCEAGDGEVTLTMTSFSPVMILTLDSAEDLPAEAPAEDVEVDAPAEDTAPAEETSSSNTMLYVVVAAVAIVVVIAVVVAKGGKKDSSKK